ncbi:hypothetical protein [Demequina aurantiaca]|uniref:hypothetical protein n=1 Tax=Demequina aurantiaca TaxID=676200 RepID=UPI003D334491
MKQLLVARDLVLGPRDEQGRIRPARPVTIIAIVVVVLALLTWLTHGYIWFFIVGVPIWWLLMRENPEDARKAEIATKTRELLAGTEVTSTYDVASAVGVDAREVESAIADMIKSANIGRKSSKEELQFLRNAQLDLIAHKVTLDPMATASRTQKLSASVNATLDRFAPAREESKPDWQCRYCRSANLGGTTVCEKCGAGRVA